MGPLTVYAALALAFAAWVTAHVSLLAGLFARRPRRHAWLALVAPPLAPYFAFVEGLRWRGSAWLVLLLVYLVLLVLAHRT